MMPALLPIGWSAPKAPLKPYISHRMEMSPMDEKLIIIMFRTDFDRLRPP
jgi:hypothetical protein